ncbi:hypothetical protein BRCON_0885 [Candidatus Sumerlaea chitinivorans]|uniref:Uncharacterized protein n=1 Tax=Sumerlaea chitinivorans TaxID=2250252 RepID=A0A2Z4Y4L3_SUMC1|nr:hypothetical protein BRCON_0885 [Candidatus Sumerlaea chitinivorans]
MIQNLLHRISSNERLTLLSCYAATLWNKLLRAFIKTTLYGANGN